jgi:hypothetical protein
VLGAVYTDTLTVRPATSEGWCVFEGQERYGYHYSLRYPEAWTVAPVGANLPNLLFSDAETEAPVLYLYRLAFDLPLERAGEAMLACASTGECQGVVGADEEVITQTVRTVGTKQVLVLVTDRVSLGRYFIVNAGELYVFEPLVEDRALVQSLEEMIASMQFGQ